MYHDVAADPTRSGYQRRGARAYRLSPTSFASHLAAIADAGVAPRLVDEFEPAASAPQLFLTVDDGGRSALEVADQIAARGWRAHFFIVTARVGDRTFLDPAGIRYLRSAGHLIGSHSHTHPDIFRELAPDAMRAEWRTSSAFLSDLLGEPCRIASVPGGDSSTAVYRSAAQSGFGYLFTSEPRIAPERVGDCWVIGRVALKQGASARLVGRLARFRGWRRALLRRRLGTLVRRGLPPLYRRYVQYVTDDREPSRNGSGVG